MPATYLKTILVSKELLILSLSLLVLSLMPTRSAAQGDMILKDLVIIKEVYYKKSQHEGFGYDLFIRYTNQQGACIHWGGGMVQPLEKARVDIMRKRDEVDWEESDIYIAGNLSFSIGTPDNCEAKEELRSIVAVSFQHSSKEWKPQWLIQTRLHILLYSPSTKQRLAYNVVFFDNHSPKSTEGDWVADRNMLLIQRMEDMEKYGCQQKHDGSLKCIENAVPLIPGSEKIATPSGMKSP